MRALLAVILAVTSMPVLAYASQGHGQDQPVEVKGNPTRTVCRRVDVAAASRIQRQRVCRTEAEWRAMSDTSADDVMETIDVRAKGDRPVLPQ